jgi:hypothetical protein
MISAFFSFVDDGETTSLEPLQQAIPLAPIFTVRINRIFLKSPASQDFGTKVLPATLLTAEGGSSMPGNNRQPLKRLLKFFVDARNLLLRSRRQRNGPHQINRWKANFLVVRLEESPSHNGVGRHSFEEERCDGTIAGFRCRWVPVFPTDRCWQNLSRKKNSLK